MSVFTNGYLSSNIQNVIQDELIKYNDLLLHYRKVNEYSIKKMYQISPSKDSFPEIVVSTIFTKILNTFQAILILYENGLASQARSLMRNNLESLYIMNVICKDQEKVFSLIDNDNAQRLRLYNSIKNNPLMEQYKHTVENNPQLEDLARNSKLIKQKEVMISKWASLSDFEQLHKTIYSVLCADTHIDIRNLEDYLILDAQHNITGLNSCPEMKSFAVDIATSIMIQLESLSTISRIFKEIEDPELNLLDEETKMYAKNYLNKEDED